MFFNGNRYKRIYLSQESTSCVRVYACGEFDFSNRGRLSWDIITAAKTTAQPAYSLALILSPSSIAEAMTPKTDSSESIMEAIAGGVFF